MSSTLKEWTGGDYRKYSDKKYLHHYDLPEGEDLIVTISDIKNELLENKMKGTQEAKLVLYFEEDIKPLALNKKINPQSISKALGSTNTSKWKGGKIALYVGHESRSEDGFAVRVRDFAPKVTEEICENCRKPIERHNNYSVNKIVQLTRSKYSKALCWDCAGKAKAALEKEGVNEVDS